MKIVICAVPFSPNLGDGAIFESIKSRYEHINPEAKIYPLDIAGRTRFEKHKSNLNKLQAFPKPIRRYIVLGYCTYKYITTWRKTWSKITQDADTITIGGGQLFLDEELNFPTKLYFLSRQLKNTPCKKNIAFIGVSSQYSLLGKLLLKRALHNIAPSSISVRDTASMKNILEIFKTKISISVVPDPALYFEERHQYASSGRKQRVAICISNPKSLDAEKKLGEAFHQNPIDFYSKLIHSIHKRDMEVSIFSNGAPEDEQLKIETGIKNSHFIKHCHRSPITPSDLKDNISQSDAIIAHRLHANIIAYSLGIPSIGLNWDEKVKSFFTSVQREKFYIDELSPSIENIIKATETTLTSHLTFTHKNLNRKIDDEIKKHFPGKTK